MASKRLGRFVSEDDQAVLDAIERRLPDSLGRRTIQGNLGRLEGRLIEQLDAIVERVVSSEATVEAATEAAVGVMTPLLDAATRQGYIAVGTPDWEHTARQAEMLERFITAEVGYFREWMESLEMSRRARVGMYGASAEAAFWRGFLSNVPTTTAIEWRLGLAEHCADCLTFAAGSPYTKGTLPAVPRDGTSRCLSNCKCSLKTGGTVEAKLWNEIGVEVIAIGAMMLDPTTPAAQAAGEIYLPMANDYAYTRRRAYLEGGMWGGIAAGILDEMNRMAEAMGHTIRLEADDAEIIRPLKIAQERGMRYVPEVESDMLGIFVAILLLDEVDRGIITRIDGPMVTIEGEKTYRIDRQGQALLFRE